MKVILATGIYPPEIGGPATYVYHLARGLVDRGVQVTVIAYGDTSPKDDEHVVRISRKGGPVKRWRRYAKALRAHGKDADIVYAFSSVSAGVPLWMSKLKHPKKVLRLGGDFLWERYTDRGGALGLREWYEEKPAFHGAMNGILKQFDQIVFSTAFQEELYDKHYRQLPFKTVIENALPSGMPVDHTKHEPCKLLFLGRFVSFKNLGSLILAMKELTEATLTIVGSGPLQESLSELIEENELSDRVTMMEPQSGDAKSQLFLDHDLLVLPSYTEISPNTALEARSLGLPVLLTEETGLSSMLTAGCMLRTLRSPRDIVNGVRDAMEQYETLSDRASAPLPMRGWDDVCDDHITLFRHLV